MLETSLGNKGNGRSIEGIREVKKRGDFPGERLYRDVRGWGLFTSSI